VKTKGDKDLKW